MIYSILITVLFIAFFQLARKSLNFELTYTSITNSLRQAIVDWKNKGSMYLLSAFFVFMLLPLFWGLTFLLKTDANVIVIILSFSWAYNWIKYVFLNEHLEK